MKHIPELNQATTFFGLYVNYCGPQHVHVINNGTLIDHNENILAVLMSDTIFDCISNDIIFAYVLENCQ